MLLMINYIFLKNFVVNFDFTFNILIWSLYISVFYICYSILIPLLKKPVSQKTIDDFPTDLANLCRFTGSRSSEIYTIS
jgi:hypothetical protein